MSLRSVTRTFTEADQLAFADLSGDTNEMHMDACAARRTLAGAPVVHGVQALLWALNWLADTLSLDRLHAVEADFARFLYVGETATLTVARHDERECLAELRTDGGRVAQYVLRFGPRKQAPEPVDPAGAPIHYDAAATEPLSLTWDEMASAIGRVEFHRSPGDAALAYPALSGAIGGGRVSAIMAATRLVGMVSPGRHSTFHRLSLALHDDTSDAVGHLSFATTKADPRYALTTTAIRAPGLSGAVKASRRPPPVAQQDSESLRGMIGAGSFAGNVALVVGGSRGLGEVTSKLLGLAGVETVVTYAAGAADAQAVADDIRATGGRAHSWPLDVTRPLAPQLAGLPVAPASMYYFATPRIALNSGTAYDAALFARFTRFYLDAFQELCTALVTTGDAPLTVFYPSTVFVDDAPRGLAEYAMAKAAGEVMAADMTRFSKRLSVDCVRLPRLPTDQTAGVTEQDMSAAAACMVPIIERVERRAAARPFA